MIDDKTRTLFFIKCFLRLLNDCEKGRLKKSLIEEIQVAVGDIFTSLEMDDAIRQCKEKEWVSTAPDIFKRELFFITLDGKRALNNVSN